MSPASQPASQPAAPLVRSPCTVQPSPLAALSSPLPYRLNMRLGAGFIVVLLSAIDGDAWLLQASPRHRPHTARLMMAAPAHKRPRPQNAPGNLFVDEGCIDCDVCRWMCPDTFARKGVKAAVHTQPTMDTDRLLAHAAAVACPVGSIRTRLPDPLAKRALTVFPAEIDPVNLPGVCHLGYHSAASYGATPYLVKRTVPDKATGTLKAANVMIDVPRFNSRLAAIIEEEGGVDKVPCWAGLIFSPWASPSPAARCRAATSHPGPLPHLKTMLYCAQLCIVLPLRLPHTLPIILLVASSPTPPSPTPPLPLDPP